MKRLFYHHNMHGTLLAVPEFLHGIRCVGGGVLQVLHSGLSHCLAEKRKYGAKP